MKSLSSVVAAAAVAALVLAGCTSQGSASGTGGSSATASSSSTSEQGSSAAPADGYTLVAPLVAKEDLGKDWTYLGRGWLDDPSGSSFGLPCSGLLEPEWQFGSEYELRNSDTANLNVPPVFEEYVLVSPPAELEQTYLTLRQGLKTCVANHNDYSLETIGVVDLFDTGSQALLVHLSRAELSPDGGATLVDHRLVLVRSNAHLMLLGVSESQQVAKYTGPSYDALVTDAELNGFVAKAVDQVT